MNRHIYGGILVGLESWVNRGIYREIFADKYPRVNGQRTLEIGTLLTLRWVGVVVAARKAVPLLPPAFGRELFCVGPGIYVLRALQSQKEHVHMLPITAAALVPEPQVLPREPASASPGESSK